MALATAALAVLPTLGNARLAAAANGQELSVEPLTPFVTALPREPVSLLFRVENDGAAQLRLLPRVELPTGWLLVVPPGELSLGPGELETVLFSVVSHAEAAAGEHEVRVLFEEPGGPALGAALFVIEVRPVTRFEVLLLEAPPVAVAEPYRLRFLVQNKGNTALDLSLSARENLGFPVAVEPEGVRLAAGESVVATVQVEVPETISRRERHRVQVIGRSAAWPAQPSVATAVVDLIPRALPGSAAYHTFPLRLGSEVTFEDEEAAFHWELSGTGRLTGTDPGRFSLRVGDERQTVSYAGEGLRISAGDQGFVLSPLTEFGVVAPGADVEIEKGPWNWQVYRRSGDEGAPARWAARVTHRLDGRGEFSLHFLEQPERSGNLWSLRGRLLQALPVSLDVEYGRQVGGDTAEAPGAVRVEAAVAAGPVIGSGSFRRLDAGYQGEERERRLFALSAELQLPAGTNLNVRWFESLEFEADALTIPATVSRQTTVSASGQQGDVYRSVWATVATERDPGKFLDQRRYSLFLRSTRPLPASRRLSQVLSWEHALDLGRNPQGRASGAHAASYEASYSLPYSHGSLELSAGWEHAFEPEPMDRFELGLGWSHRIGDRSELHLSAKVEDLLEQRYRLWGMLSSRLAGGHEIRIRGSSLWSAGSGSDFEVSFTYVFSLDVRLGRRSDVGELFGLVVDEAERGISGLVVQLDGLATVTQEDGSFRFPAVEPGTFFLTIRPEQLGPERLTVPATPWQVEIEPGRVVEQTFRVVRAATLTGRVEVRPIPARALESGAVFGEAGPEGPQGLVAGLLVELSRDGGRDGGGEVRLRLTGRDGAFVFDGLPPGEWTLRVHPTGLPEGYEIRPVEQRLTLQPGARAAVTVQIVPLAREIRFLEGAPLQPQPEG